MKSFLQKTWNKEKFNPSFILGIWINPFFIIRRGLINGVREISSHMNQGKLLDVGCGSKPYEKLFNVMAYIGIDIEISGHNHSSSKVDKFYDGKKIPLKMSFLKTRLLQRFLSMCLTLTSYLMK